ncbi:hypothetical protein [Lacihabitans soyangensis]|uniref:Uncharacterized protein n=1 Tax=Lacihabitans soyangensis TaxID=869394 RepID=A0AAE3H266_9BACT|nr:hypothetical protein [Lacihabitans soyangensis]MCP9763592.1 hypothetical protein [Lacihabitans soyangensis]
MPKILLLVFFAGIMVSCQKFESFQENDPSYANEGYFVKTSLSKLELNNLRLEQPRAIGKVSDMFVDEKYLYVAEYAKGVHVFKNPNAVKPEAMAFINVPALRKFTVKDGFLICDSGNDLISFKISGLDLLANRLISVDSLSASTINFGLANRKSDLFTFPNYPIERNVYFECPDSVDFVIEWEKKVMDKKLNCYR